MTEVSIANPFGGPVRYAEALASTMDAARQLAGEGAPSGTVVVAGFQSAGRGRTGRSWQAPPGENLLFTILLRYAGPEKIPDAPTLRAGLGVSRGIDFFFKARGFLLKDQVRIKWPNDIMLGSRKAAGILAESDGRNVYIGVGVNFSQQDFPEELQRKAVSLASACGAAFPPEDRFGLLEAILGRLSEAFQPAEPWREALLDRLYLRGQTVRFIPGAPGAGSAVTGVLSGVAPDGALLLTLPGAPAPQPFAAGELDVYGG